MSDKPLVKDADPTSPFGMGQAALAKELINRHGWTRVAALALSHKQRAEAVVQGRAERDTEDRCEKHETMNCAECSGVAQAHDESLTEPDKTEPGKTGGAMFEVVGSAVYDADDDSLDPDELMAELVAVREEQEQYVIQHGLLVKDPHTKDYIFDGHAGAGPSASERWMSCTASLEASRAFLETLTPNQQETYAHSGDAARQGTTAHAAAEVEANVILGRLTEQEASLTMLELSILPETDGEAYDEEMGEYITEYVDLVKSYAQDRGSENVLIEARVAAAVPLTGVQEGEVYEIKGSADFIALPTPEEPVLVVGDLKYGNGIWVGVDENSQAMIYAIGALALIVDGEGKLPVWVDDITLHIVQPRMDGIKTAHLTVDELLDWRDEVLAPALTAALSGVDGGATFAPSEGACQFCPARGACPALAEQRVTAAAGLFDTIVESEYDGTGFPETTSLTDTRLGELLAQVAGLVDLHKDLKAEAERRLYRGGSVPGFGLVNYTPPRKWKDTAVEALAEVDEVWKRALITPTQAVKLAEANAEEWDIEALNDLIDVPDKRPVVAKEGDRRKPWTGRPPEAMFDDEGTE